MTERIRANLRRAAAVGHRLALLAQTLLPREEELLDTERAEQHRVALDKLRLSCRNLLNHPPMLVGYFDGYAARTHAREAVQSRLPPEDATLLRTAARAARTFAETVEALASRENFDLAPEGPRVPGPERTAAVARAHVESLMTQLPIVLIELADSPEIAMTIRELIAEPAPEA